MAPEMWDPAPMPIGGAPTVQPSPLHVPDTELASLEEHPALLVTTVLDLPYTDVRQLGRARKIVVTKDNTTIIDGAGDASLVQGPSVGAVLVEEELHGPGVGIVDALGQGDGGFVENGPRVFARLNGNGAIQSTFGCTNGVGRSGQVIW